MKKTETGDKDGKCTVIDAAAVDITFGLRRKWLIGVDEVGRGPLAGPVTVGAAAVLVEGSISGHDMNEDIQGAHAKIRIKFMEHSGREYPIGVDSKKMKEKDRDFWFEVIGGVISSSSSQEPGFSFHSTALSKEAAQIDGEGIAVCISELVDLNIRNILGKIQEEFPQAQFADLHVFLDGGLKTRLPVGSQKTIIKGDEKDLLISIASVHAKVTRDRHMEELSKNPKYDKYGFEAHKGYGTAKHREAISGHGLSDEHRASFCGNIVVARS